jgi:hypothetical protein
LDASSVKKKIFCKMQRSENQTSLVESSNEGYGSKRAGPANKADECLIF